ncbi:hypothetical protein QBC35DRAFT_43960 [Podospora australis]|uniref:Transmembrane protein n=1 Tax=Podospora australis TaxID=1536484 RepID=A0AAN6X2L0_9PEZI|nr:hypothetical protein QBC35DRAFT_43960 [Podospora australis]
MAPQPQDNQGQPAADDPFSGHGDSDGTLAGASGTSTGGVTISKGALIAIVVVVVFVALFGIASSVLFFVAKKREWTVKETIRRSARKVVTVLTPRRSEFPRSVKESVGGGSGGSRGKGMRLDDVPPTPRIAPEHLKDLEKGGPGPFKKSGGKKLNFSRK